MSNFEGIPKNVLNRLEKIKNNDSLSEEEKINQSFNICSFVTKKQIAEYYGRSSSWINYRLAYNHPKRNKKIK